jgi:Zn-dependent membrane protease YugP
MYYGIDPYYFLLVIPAMIIAMIAQFRVTSTFNKFNKQSTARGMTGAQAARMILDANGLQHIRIEHVQGKLADHYDHANAVIRLSDSTYASSSVSAVGVAAHEAGHAVQYGENYGPIRLRMAMVPVTNIGATLSTPLILLGFIMGFGMLVTIGIALFSLAVLFQLVTLPVEYNASRRAMKIMQQSGILYDEELDGARKVLSSAALTYVASMMVSVASLLRLLLLFSGGRNRN